MPKTPLISSDGHFWNLVCEQQASTVHRIIQMQLPSHRTNIMGVARVAMNIIEIIMRRDRLGNYILNPWSKLCPLRVYKESWECLNCPPPKRMGQSSKISFLLCAATSSHLMG